MRKKRLSLAVVALTGSIALGGGSAAFAQDSTVDDESSTETTEGVQGVCSSGWLYMPGAVETDGFLPVGGFHANYNGTEAPALVTFTSDASATLGAAVDGSVNVGIDGKIASASAAFGVNYQISMTASIGNQIQITVPPGQYGYGEFGIWSQYVKGEEVHMQGIGPVCNVVERRSAGLKAPYRAGWNTWTG